MMQILKRKIRDELSQVGLPDFNFIFSQEVLDIAPELLGELLLEDKSKFQKLLETEDDNITFELFDDESLLDYFVGYLYHLKGVFSSDVIRKILEDFEPQLVEFGNEAAYSQRYYEMLLICKKQCHLDSDQDKIISDCIEVYEVRGIALPLEKQNELKDISQKLSKITTDFSNNVLDSENEFNYTIKNFDSIQNLPQDVLTRTQCGEEYVFGSNPSDYINIMKYCDDTTVRKDFQQARVSFASKGKFDNRENVLKILALKNQKAKILGFNNYAELSLFFKMADSSEQILELLHTVSIRAQVKGKEEITFLKDYFSLSELNEWDVGYYFRKLKEEKYKLDDKELKKYFEFEAVLSGLHSITSKLFGLELCAVSFGNIDGKSWLSDVRLYEVYKDGKHIAYYMLDAFYRDEKRSGAWANNLRNKTNKKVPLIVNVCNFTQGEEHTLLSMLEVETLFHEFGHATHEMLGTSQYSELSGFGVEWDFVEVPSQFLEHWAEEKESLLTFAKHYESGEVIGDNFLEKLKELDTLGNGIGVLKQNEYAFQDMLLYSQDVPSSVEELDTFTLKNAQAHSLFNKNENYKPYASFSHIFSGGYSAGYYSYMWAEILELDILREFKKKGMFDGVLSKKYTECILQAGSTKKASVLFNDFMGRGVDVEGFFEKKGI